MKRKIKSVLAFIFILFCSTAIAHAFIYRGPAGVLPHCDQRHAYGEFYFYNGTFRPLTIVTAGEWYPMVSTLTQPWVLKFEDNVDADISVGNGSFTIKEDGRYCVTYTASYSSSRAATEFQAAVHVNGVIENSIHSFREAIQSVTKTHTDNNGCLDLKRNDVVDMRWTADVSDTEVQVYSASFKVEMKPLPE